MGATRTVNTWTRAWGLTLFSLGMIQVLPLQAQQETLTHKTGRGDDSQDHHAKHHHYQLEVIPSLGGLLTNFYHPENNIAVLNRQGSASGGSADTLLPERFPNYPWGDAGTTTHAYVWESGSLTDLGALDKTLSSFSAWISSNGIIAGASEQAECDPLVPGIVHPSVPDFPETTAVVTTAESDIGFLPGGGYESRAVSVNNRGEVIGAATNLIHDANSFAVDSVFLLSKGYNYQSRAFIWDSMDGMRDLGTLGTGLDSAAYAINEQGQVIGYSYKDTTVYPMTASTSAHRSASPSIVNHIAREDLLNLYRGGHPDYKRIADLARLSKADLSKISGVAKSSVRFDAHIPEPVAERLREIANIANLVAEFFSGDAQKVGLWFEIAET